MDFPSRPTQNRDPDLNVSGEESLSFYEREFYVLSNFSSFQVEWHGRLWPTSEHAYQAAHFFETAPDLVYEIIKARSAHEAFKIAQTNADKAPADWDEIKVRVMEEICWAKLVQHEYVQRKLMQTGDMPLIEDSPKDGFWGWGEDHQGRNELGKIWMRLRDEWRDHFSDEE